MTRLNVFLTEKGKAAHKQHMDFHAQLDCMVDDAMGARQQSEIAGIANFLEELLASLNAVEVK